MGKTYKKVSVVKHSSNFSEATEVVETPLVDPSDDQILVKILYAGVNATDVNISAGRYGSDGTLPFDSGLEGIGVIEAVGKNVNSAKPGDSGIVMGKPAYAEYVYVKQEEFIPIPIAKPELLASLVCGLTASIGLDKYGHIKKEDKVLITAAAGGTGHIAVQWAKRKGCHVIGTCSSDDKVELLKQLGCNRVINYKKESIDDVLTNEYPNGIDVVWETIGGSVFETLVKHLATEGRLVIVGSIIAYKSEGFAANAKFPSPRQIIMKSLSINGFFLYNSMRFVKEYMKNLIELILSNELKIILDFGDNSSNGRFNGVESVVRGVEYQQSGKSVGKVVIKISN